MSFFRDYLKLHDQEPDFRFEETDENWFVLALLFLRIGFQIDMWKLGRQFLDPDSLVRTFPWPDTLVFVSRFLCFFVPKPPGYQHEISSFKDFFIPGFAQDDEKQELLFTSAKPSFSTTPLEEAKWETVADYFVLPQM
jgi:hypothetical protein